MEYVDVGLTNHFTISPLLSNKYGSFGFQDANLENKSSYLSLDESLVPFINEIHSDRAVLAYTHRSQAAPITEGQVPIVATGAEYLVSQISSSKFIQTAKKDGEILEREPDKYVKVKYKDGIIEYIDITPRLTATKRGSYIRLGFTISENNTFKKNEAIAWTNAFKDNAYSIGRNLTIAVANYMGFSHEDGYVLSEEAANHFEGTSVEEVNVILPENVNILNIITEPKITENGEPLIEFTYTGDIDNYIEDFNILDEESEENESSLYKYIGNKISTNSPGGEITDIKVYLNSRTSVDNKVLTLWKKTTKDLKDRQKLYEYGKKTAREKITAIDNLDMSQIKIGGHKYRGNEFPSARIVYYIKHTKVMNNGDKLSNRYGAKGVVTKKINSELVPKGEYSGNVDIFISPISILGRRNLCTLKEIYIGKIFYNLPNILANKVDTSNIDRSADKIKKIIFDIYDKLDTTRDKKYLNEVKKNMNSYSNSSFLKAVQEKTIKFNFIVQAFSVVTVESIKEILLSLNIPPDEHIYIPELKMWSKKPVPVGIQYINAMEQIAEDYESLRSTGGYKSATGQPLKGRSNSGGQSIGNLDLYALLSYNTPATLEELMNSRSDDFKSKRQITIDIIENGNADLPENTGDGATYQLYKTHLIAMGISPD